MKSVLRIHGTGKKKKVLGEVEGFTQDDFSALEREAKVDLIQALIPLGLMHVSEMLEDEIESLAGRRYSRDGGEAHLSRHGSNRSSVKLAGQRHPIRVPRLRNTETNREVPLKSWQSINGTGEVNEVLLRRVLYGVSCRNYEAASEAVPGAIGLSSSTVSRQFVEASAERLKALQERDLSSYDVVALVLDGKTFADDTMVMALGITLSGEKVILGFVQTGTENAQVIGDFLTELCDRGLRTAEGLLVVIDGSKGIRAAVKRAFKEKAVIQRCQWHKRENVVRYLPKAEQNSMRRKLQKAYEKATYKEAQAALQKIQTELETRNACANRSLEEGLEETLTLHRLGVFQLLGRSLKTTNCLESINGQVEERCGKVDCWKNSSQKHRWLASALLDIEPRLNRVMGCKHLPLLREKLKAIVGLNRTSQAA